MLFTIVLEPQKQRKYDLQNKKEKRNSSFFCYFRIAEGLIICLQKAEVL